ncbi:decaprenyl-phosphate phosphoribosyltransferase [Nocardiopsis kunsanensis]|uniref:Decaprenyl-phosphate phosphoribosyltransferase n=1 Tax=Nocardiopsis kunsanensis TaxID=141693 RepID=A0A918XAP2_9ACTN|nr:decaprenyl-phosphate phosphoribosyltransferase [Nocardiopsis kunsanensis]GHD22695.1 decaprenyl-phosphate phosphoribosyltransferase [Nocardiopsis kunsanensis]
MPGRPPSATTARITVPSALLRACRPRQWPKNLLVLAAPAAAGALSEPSAWFVCGAVVALFCLAASGTYLLNDVRDVESDRAHERKRRRPVASGALPLPLALVAGAAMTVTAPLSSLLLGDPVLTAIITGYVALTAAYTFLLKNIVLVDLVSVAGCHILRAAAGAAAVGVPMSGWFVLVVAMGALLLVSGKREAEHRGSTPVRRTLGVYTASFLTGLRIAVSAVLVVTYCLWALSQSPWHAASAVPLFACTLRYNMLVDRGAGEEPEEIALRDRPLQTALVVLIALVGMGIYP